MSLSADPNGFSRPSGKTPPPAPSAAFAKRCVVFAIYSIFYSIFPSAFYAHLDVAPSRAREMGGESMIGRYRPPALRALASGGSPPNEHNSPSTTTPADSAGLPPSTYPAGFRRARAGTLPSNISLAAQQYAQASNLTSLPSTESFADQLQQHAASPAQTPSSAVTPMRPSLRHSASVASSVAASALTERNSRLRSGSLTTLPSKDLSTAFNGGSIFAHSWLSSGNHTSSFSPLDELRSVTSMDSGADEFDVHTLDYLGLDETHYHHRQPQVATMSELRQQAQAQIAGNVANPPRLRASTVSNPYRRMPSTTGSLLSTPNAEEEDMYEQLHNQQGLDSYGDMVNDANYLPSSYVAKGFRQSDHLGANLTSSRPRAISVGTLDNPTPVPRRPAPPPMEQIPSPYELTSPMAAFGGASVNQMGASAGILKSDKLGGPRGAASPTVRFPNGELPGARTPTSYLGAPGQQGRAVSPKNEQATQMQTPTRSLWIGNLDSSVTSEQLIHVFAPYGAIESLRLLPEKVGT